MTSSGRRPGWLPVLLLAFFALVMVVSFSRGEFLVSWFVGLGGSFLTMELWHAITRSGDTFSESWWAILGIFPPAAARLLRSALASLFIVELGAHIVAGGRFWWCGGTAIISTAIPISFVAFYSLVFDRRKRLQKGGTS